jgi:two-component system, NarL family, nitrate/nitrite response regulator NarL
MAGSQLVFASRSLPRHADEPLRVTVASENPLRRAALAMRLAVFGDLALSEAAVIDEIRDADVVLADTIDASRASAPVLYLVRDSGEAAQAIGRGARGVMLRTAAPQRLHSGIRAVADGMMVVDDEVSDAVMSHVRARVALIEPLTAREQQVAQLLAGGLTNKEIAQRLNITGHTVKFHLNGILRKLGVSTRTEAVVQAARLGLLVL